LQRIYGIVLYQKGGNMVLAYTRNKVILSLFISIGVACVYFSVITSRERENEEQSFVPAPGFDLEKIKARGKIIALTDNSSTSFYIYKGDSMGYEYELLNTFAKELGVKLELVIAKDMNSIFRQLNNCEVDIIAANLTVTKDRLYLVDFTDPLMLIPQVLVQRKPDGWNNMTSSELNKNLIRSTVELNEKSIHVRKGSSFYTRLMNLAEETGQRINIIEVPGEYDTEQLIGKVANGEIDYTIADENVALSNQTYYPNIDVEMPISFPQKIAWAIRKESPQLKHALNEWLAKRKTSRQDLVVYNKYFKARKKVGGKSGIGYASYSEGIISEYDDLIKLYSQKIGWDWTLLASMIYQESKFSPTARSWAGANGFMQLVPATAKRYGLDTIDATAEQSLEAGTEYILDLDKYWRSQISDKDERIKFVLGSYNAGIGHVIDARNLAVKHGKDPDLWYDNVDFMLLQKSNPMIYNDPIVKCGYCRGQETYQYVREILDRYQHYRRMPAPKENIASN
jgi:membrane-bound lytic murein transglycosylase F